MDADEFRKMGHEMVEFIACYMEKINSMPVFPDVKPGFLVKHLPSSAPEEGEQWNEIYEDVNKLILPGVGSSAKGYSSHVVFVALPFCFCTNLILVENKKC